MSKKELGNALFHNIELLIEESRRKVAHSINVTMCETYYSIGKMIVINEQQGNDRAKYGSETLKNLSQYLSEKFGRGFSVTTLKMSRKFYQRYTDEKGQLIIDQFKLSWSHYQFLVQIDDKKIRSFYEQEAYNDNWTVERLKREYRSSLYERLATNRDLRSIESLSAKGLALKHSSDILKDPYVLDFLDMPQEPFSESILEEALVSKLQKFLLELGKGFLFEARQKRILIDDKSFYTDLVFYNRLLQCYVIIDLKTQELKHEDLGQMQMYVNYYDRYVKTEHENPTIGILLCREASKSIVELTLPKDSRIYASQYSLIIPQKEVLQEKLSEWIEELEVEELYLKDSEENEE